MNIIYIRVHVCKFTVHHNMVCKIKWYVQEGFLSSGSILENLKFMQFRKWYYI